MLDERGLTGAVLAQEQHVRLALEVSVGEQGGVEGAKLERLLDGPDLGLVDLLEGVDDAGGLRGGQPLTARVGPRVTTPRGGLGRVGVARALGHLPQGLGHGLRGERVVHVAAVVREALELGDGQRSLSHRGVQGVHAQLRDLGAALHHCDDPERAHELVFTQVPLAVEVRELPRARERLLGEAREPEKLHGILAGDATVLVLVGEAEPSLVRV